MPDRILINDLRLRTILGIWDEERTRLQDVVVNMTLFVDTHSAAESDDIRDAVDYHTIVQQVTRHVEQSQYYLVEKLAAQISALCLADRRVQRVEVTVQKPEAIPSARNVGVTIERSRDDQ